jgi:epoxyqueuosine reductase QueG
MPLIPDAPVDLGVQEFCSRCLQCADSCPSRSIPKDKKTLYNGAEKWKLDADSCFDYWAVIGTGCSICMAVCPFSRPNRSFHRLARWAMSHSSLARKVLPHVDNVVYGKKWRPRRALDWIRYPSAADRSH